MSTITENTGCYDISGCGGNMSRNHPQRVKPQQDTTAVKTGRRCKYNVIGCWYDVTLDHEIDSEIIKGYVTSWCNNGLLNSWNVSYCPDGEDEMGLISGDEFQVTPYVGACSAMETRQIWVSAGHMVLDRKRNCAVIARMPASRGASSSRDIMPDDVTLSDDVCRVHSRNLDIGYLDILDMSNQALKWSSEEAISRAISGKAHAWNHQMT
ncbi:hypothetical protein DPMN_147069 [Dreissena polymorpha]|uniref:Uncharacterized protein n=1 Tax=Dreissena polymorpha TaxID=45954 RepID=A0A9D4F756_DREPO|nr:hypothetical protein DPMN_147069 [Dreissena polymorpha]